MKTAEEMSDVELHRFWVPRAFPLLRNFVPYITGTACVLHAANGWSVWTGRGEHKLVASVRRFDGAHYWDFCARIPSPYNRAGTAKALQWEQILDGVYTEAMSLVVRGHGLLQGVFWRGDTLGIRRAWGHPVPNKDKRGPWFRPFNMVDHPRAVIQCITLHRYRRCLPPSKHCCRTGLVSTICPPFYRGVWTA